jgi:hypothetical protein
MALAVLQSLTTGELMTKNDIPRPVWILDMFFFGYLFAVGHILLLERVLATVRVSRYENHRSPWFSVGWFSIVVNILKVVRNFFF